MSAATPGKQTGAYKVLAWNDLGMHCYNSNFANLAVLPPYNNLWAQVVHVGEEPRVVTQGIKVSYFFADNTHSADKSNFWQYAKQLFGVDLKLDTGLAGKGLKGEMDLKGDHFEAIGIPLTEYSDSNPTVRAPFQLATVVVTDAATGQELTRAQVVAPVSTEMRCDTCHKKDGMASTKYPINPVDSAEINILKLHDYKRAKDYPAGHTPALESRQPILCAECHSSNALGANGQPNVASLSNAIHGAHSKVSQITPDINGCYNCHPGPQTQCLRDVMSVRRNFTCEKCHGELSKVAQNQNPWLNEPRCDAQGCHAGKVQQNQALYRQSQGHGGLYCEACHDSTHAIARSREPNDAIKFIELQGKAGTLNQCEVCHGTRPDEPFPHNGGGEND
jgi:hypothetical protein